MSNTAPRLYLTDKNNNRVAEIIDYRRVQFRQIFNGVGRWSISLPRDTVVLMERGGGIQLQTPGGKVLEGVTISVRVRPGSTVAMVAGYGKLWWLQKRLAYPEVSGDFAAQAHDVRTGPVETVVKGYVADNASQAAPIVSRRWPFVVAADMGRGETVVGRARWHNLLALCADLLAAAGEAYRMVLSGGVYDLEPVVDRRGYPTFADWNDVTGWGYSWRAPQASAVLAAGQGEGAARVTVERIYPADVVQFGRIEEFYDMRAAIDAVELSQRADAYLAKRRSRYGYVLRIESRGRYGVDYAEGDLVTVQIEGKPFEGRVLDVLFRYDENSGWREEVGVGISAVEAFADALMLSDLHRRMENLEVAL